MLGPIRAQGDCFYGAANKRVHEAKLLSLCNLSKNAVALASNVDRDLIRQVGRGSAGARGISEDVQISEGQLFDKTASDIEFGVSFAGESDHDVGTNSCARHRRADLLDLFPIMPGTIFAMHAAKYRAPPGWRGCGR